MNYGKNKRKHLPFVLKDVITFEKKKMRNLQYIDKHQYWILVHEKSQPPNEDPGAVLTMQKTRSTAKLNVLENYKSANENCWNIIIQHERRCQNPNLKNNIILFERQEYS